MKDVPILMTKPLVQMTLAGKKTQTRRVVTAQNSTVNGYSMRALWAHLHHWEKAWVDGPPDPMGGGDGYQYLHVPAWNPLDGPVPVDEREWMWYRVRPKVEPGDQLWVKETCWIFGRWVTNGITDYGRAKWRFETVGQDVRFDEQEKLPREQLGYHKRPGIFCPKWASRVRRVITTVRCQRVQEISPRDAEAEGVTGTEFWQPKEVDENPKPTHLWKAPFYDDYYFWNHYPQMVFAHLWDSINAARGYSWGQNDLVWVYDFGKAVE